VGSNPTAGARIGGIPNLLVAKGKLDQINEGRTKKGKKSFFEVDLKLTCWTMKELYAV